VSRFENVPGQTCPACGEALNSTHSVVGATSAQVGDYGVCMRCGHILRYGERLQLRAATEAELHEAAARFPNFYRALTDCSRYAVLRNPLDERRVDVPA
jgi:hypothetical protein